MAEGKVPPTARYAPTADELLDLSEAYFASTGLSNFRLFGIATVVAAAGICVSLAGSQLSGGLLVASACVLLGLRLVRRVIWRRHWTSRVAGDPSMKVEFGTDYIELIRNDVRHVVPWQLYNGFHLLPEGFVLVWKARPRSVFRWDWIDDPDAMKMLLLAKFRSRDQDIE